jgi:hypothetical protein
MSESQTIRERLELTLARLDAAANRIGPLSAGQAQAARDARGLRDERERLGRMLADLQADNAALRTTSDAVAARLDRAISRIKSMLGAP